MIKLHDVTRALCHFILYKAKFNGAISFQDVTLLKAFAHCTVADICSRTTLKAARSQDLIELDHTISTPLIRNTLYQHH